MAEKGGKKGNNSKKGNKSKQISGQKNLARRPLKKRKRWIVNPERDKCWGTVVEPEGALRVEDQPAKLFVSKAFWQTQQVEASGHKMLNKAVSALTEMFEISLETRQELTWLTECVGMMMQVLMENGHLDSEDVEKILCDLVPGGTLEGDSEPRFQRIPLFVEAPDQTAG